LPETKLRAEDESRFAEKWNSQALPGRETAPGFFVRACSEV
jgi:hypothetical protein